VAGGFSEQDFLLIVIFHFPTVFQSINDLAVIFKDLALLIVDQGTVLDRIDYNIEHAATDIDQGHKELEQVCLWVVTNILLVDFWHGK
jgi:hypothetical protein